MPTPEEIQRIMASYRALKKEYPDHPNPNDKLDLRSAEINGITSDFFNEIIGTTPDERTDNFINRCQRDKRPKTYTERFGDRPHIIEASDKKIVEEIDTLMTEAIEVAKAGNRETVKTKLEEIESIRKKIQS